jgi:hypothetical protein
MAKFNDAYKWEVKNKTNVQSERSIRREEIRELTSFGKMFKDKYWWKSLTHDDKMSVHRSYYTNSRYKELNYNDWLSEVMLEYGDRSKRRELVIDILLES